MTPLPPASQLAMAGMGFLMLFAMWKVQVQPRLHRARARRLAANV